MMKKKPPHQFPISNFQFLKDHSGFSLLEIILGVVIIGIAFVGAMYALSAIESRGARVETFLRATSMANSIMEVIRSNRFDENTSPPWGTVLGPEESSPQDYDDVDDYIGFSWSFSEYPGYQGSTRVFYVNPTISWIDSINAVTNYKRIIVTVHHEGLDTPIVLSSLVTPRTTETGTGGGLGGPPPPPGL
jgi:MSHA pilin protein MshD